MNDNKTTNEIDHSQSHTSPQLKVRTNLRSGESLDACQKNLNSWQKEYNKWYDLVKEKKPTPC